MILASPERIAEYTARGWWGPARIHDWFEQAVGDHPERVALVDPPNRAAVVDGEPRRLTWRELDDEVLRLAAALLDAGLQRDDVVCIQLPNCVELIAAYLACLRLGLIASPVPVQYREHELEYILRTSEARAFLTATRILRHDHAQMGVELARRLPGPLRVLAHGADVPAGATPMRELLAAGADPARVRRHEREHPVGSNDVATICWTSGTEGQPKGVPRSHNEWLSIPENIILSGGLQPGCSLLNPYPLVNMAGIAGLLLPWLIRAGKLVQHHPFDLPLFIRQLRDEAVEYTICAPVILTRLAQNPALLQGVNFGRLRTIGSGGGPLSEWAVRELWQRHGLQVVNYFGSNEGASLTSSPLDVPDPALRATCFPRFGAGGLEWRLPVSRRVKTRLVDPQTGLDVTAPGVSGELRVKGPAIFSGYWRSPQLTERAFDEQEYYRSGDLFVIDGDGGRFYRYVGRLKDIIVRGGFNISAEEIESLVAEHPAVAEVAAVGYPDDALGERVCVFVVPKAGATIDLPALVSFLRNDKRLAAFKLPERLELLTALPRNALGKPMKRELRSRLPPHGDGPERDDRRGRGHEHRHEQGHEQGHEPGHERGYVSADRRRR